MNRSTVLYAIACHMAKLPPASAVGLSGLLGDVMEGAAPRLLELGVFKPGSVLKACKRLGVDMLDVESITEEQYLNVWEELTRWVYTQETLASKMVKGYLESLRAADASNWRLVVWEVAPTLDGLFGYVHQGHRGDTVSEWLWQYADPAKNDAPQHLPEGVDPAELEVYWDTPEQEAAQASVR